MSLLPLINFAIGKEVRVTTKNSVRNSRRGMISYVNDQGDEHTYDIIFQLAQNALPDEENAVARDRLFDILPFEEHSLSSLNDPVVVKEYANQLFQIQDYDTAYQYYIRAHKLVQQSTSFSFGQRIIISLPTTGGGQSSAKRSASTQQKQRTGLYICVTVSDVVSDTEVDVMYDTEVRGRDEEEGVDISRVLLLLASQSGTRPAKWCSLINITPRPPDLVSY